MWNFRKKIPEAVMQLLWYIGILKFILSSNVSNFNAY